MSRLDELKSQRASWEGLTAEEQVRKDNEEAGKSGGGFVPAEYTALVAGGYSLLRLVGYAYPTAYDLVKDCFDPVLLEEGFFKGDNGKWHKVKCRYGDNDHILKKAVKTVCAYEWNAELKQKMFKHTNSKLFNLLARNEVESPYAKGWNFEKVVMWNVVDRARMGWHKENNQTLLLTKNLTQSTDGKVYPSESGIKKSIYEKPTHYDEESKQPIKSFTLFEVISEHGMYIDYDVLLWRKKYDPNEKKDPKTFWYKAFRAKDRIDNISEKEKSYWDTNFIDEPADEWLVGLNKYNTQMLSQPTKASTVKKGFGQTLKEIDREFGTNYFEQLEAQVEKEKIEESPVKVKSLLVTDDGLPVGVEEVNEGGVTTRSNTQQMAPQEDYSEPPFPEQTRKPVRRPAQSSDASGEPIEDKLKAHKYHVEMLSPENLKDIQDVNTQGEIIFAGKFDLLECPNSPCKFLAPESWDIGCPKCGTFFKG